MSHTDESGGSVAGLVLAAGASSRMGTPKASLPLGEAGQTVLSLGVAALLGGGVPRVVIVSGAYPDAVNQALGHGDHRVRVVHHPGWEEGQLSSLLAGLAAVSSPDLQAIVMTLVDVPLVSAQTVRAVLDGWRATRRPIVRPARGDAHGHPVVFDRAVFDELRRADPSVGAKAVVRAHEAEILNVPVNDDGAFLDLDTPEDYERVRRWAKEKTARGMTPDR